MRVGVGGITHTHIWGWGCREQVYKCRYPLC
jgi:hypothetical protein